MNQTILSKDILDFFDLSKFDITKQTMDSIKSILYAFEDIWSLKECKNKKERKAILRKILLSVKKDLKYESKQYRIDVLLSIKQYFMNYDSQVDEGLFKEVSEEITKELGGEDIMDELDFTMAGVIQKARQEAIKEGMEEGIREGKQQGIQKGMQQGIEQDIQKGMQKGRREITLKLLNADMSVEKVSEITGLSKQEIHKFQKDAKK